MFYRLCGVLIDESIISVISYIITTYFVGRQRRKLLSELLALWHEDSIKFLKKWQACLKSNLSSSSINNLNRSQLNTSSSISSVVFETRAQKERQTDITTLRNEFHSLVREATQLKLELREYRHRYDNVIRYAISFLYYNIFCFSRRETIGKSLFRQHLISPHLTSNLTPSTIVLIPLNELLFFFNTKIFMTSQIRYMSNFISDYLRLSFFVKSLTPTQLNLQTFLRLQVQPESKESTVNDNNQNNDRNDELEEGSSSSSSSITTSTTTRRRISNPDISRYAYSFLMFPGEEHLDNFQYILEQQIDYIYSVTAPEPPEICGPRFYSLRVLTKMTNWFINNSKHLSFVVEDLRKFQGELELFLGKQKDLETFGLFCSSLVKKYESVKQIDDYSTESNSRRLDGTVDIMISAGKFIFDWLSASVIEELLVRCITTATSTTTNTNTTNTSKHH